MLIISLDRRNRPGGRIVAQYSDVGASLSTWNLNCQRIVLELIADGITKIGGEPLDELDVSAICHLQLGRIKGLTP